MRLIRSPVTRPEWRLSRVIVQGADITDAGINVPPNTTLDDIVVEITNDRSEVSGHVVDARGNIVRDCFVVMFAQDPARWSFQSPSLAISRPGQDPNDRYRLRPVPGDYFLSRLPTSNRDRGTTPNIWPASRIARSEAP